MNIPSFVEICCDCGMPFEVTKAFHSGRLADKKSFYCPNGHQQHYVGETEEQRLKKIIAQKDERLSKMNEKLPKKYRNTI